MTFCFFLPQIYTETILTPQTNNIFKDVPLYFGEFFHFIGLWFLITSFPGYNRRIFFDNSFDIFKGAPIQLNFYMAGHIFEKIIAALLFTDISLPSFKDKWFEVYHMVDGWNQHMKDVVIPLWVYCLDNSISICTNKFT